MLNFKDPVTVVIGIFAVVVGAALERFLTARPMDLGQNVTKRSHRELFYWSALIVLLSLIIRFFVGAAAHLAGMYLKPDALKPWDMYLLFKDMVFLIVFGVFLVKVAISK